MQASYWVRNMRIPIVILLCLGLFAGACSKAPEERQYPLTGQIIGISSDRLEATIKHDEIKGLMEAMTMPYRVKDAKEFEGLVPGDLISATLVVVSSTGHLKDVKKVGTAPLAPATSPPPSTGVGPDLLTPGQPVPNMSFLDQEGQPRRLDGYAGSVLLLTFTYTRCPMPTFCPLMDRHFATLQQAVMTTPVLADRVHLLTVSIDPEADTPPVLKAHAQTLRADPRFWTFLTGARDEIDRFAARFGMTVVRDGNDALNITHTLRTAIIDSRGRLVKVYAGNDWTPPQMLAVLKPLAETEGD